MDLLEQIDKQAVSEDMSLIKSSTYTPDPIPIKFLKKLHDLFLDYVLAIVYLFYELAHIPPP